MASLEFNQQIRQGVDALRADDDSQAPAGCRAGDLKGLLNAIVDQISEADRRHSDTLQQLQDRLTTLGRDAKAIKPRVPDSYAAAFERIEAGMSELASRIAEAAEVRGDLAPAQMMRPNLEEPAPSDVVATHAHAPAPAAAFTYSEPPAALRSASDATQRRRDEIGRAPAGVDTFDVIETSLPGNVSDPWDRDAAEALTGHYESGAAGYSAKPIVQDTAPAPYQTMQSVAGFSTTPATVAPAVDTGWLEARFAEISKRIDESLNDIRPDQGFFALGQRVERFEQHFNSVIENVASRNDVEGIRLIESHVSELAGHLENAHQQLMRLDAIEAQLDGIASKLEDVHHAATASASELGAAQAAAPEIDVSLVARTAAEAAAQQFAKMQPATQPQDGTEVRDMLRTYIAEARQGEENTTALLDTLQQAMIRLLDRVDSMELNAFQSAQAQAQAAPQEYVREQVRFASEPARAPISHDAAPSDALDAAVAAVASAKTMASPFSAQAASASELGVAAQTRQAGDASSPRSPEKMRQDFIAEARRAKMRLAAESASEETTAAEMPQTAAQTESARATGAALRQTGKAPAVKGGKSPVEASALAPRLRVLGLAAILTAAGAYGALTFMKTSETSTPMASEMPAPASNSVAQENPAAAPNAVGTSKGEGALEPTNTIPPGTRGEIVSDEITVGATSVPLTGVTVDAERPMTAADLARAARQQAMANVSGQLGQAAAQNPAAVAMPAAIQPNAAGAGELGLTNVPKGGMTQSSALDLPPATVGPLSLRLAAANGDPSAEFEVGARLAEGKGTNQNFKDAAKWYQRSASRGFAQAQYRLGTLYERGLGLKADTARATEWYTRAAEQGNVKAMHNLAVLSANQSGGSPDYAAAATWFEKAAELGLSDSQFNLAVLNENGLGVGQDLPNAYKWLSLAAKSGDKEAIRRRDILKGKLTAEQLSKADALIASWRAKTPDAQVNDPRKAGEAWKQNPANGVNG